MPKKEDPGEWLPPLHSAGYMWRIVKLADNEPSHLKHTERKVKEKGETNKGNGKQSSLYTVQGTGSSRYFLADISSCRTNNLLLFHFFPGFYLIPSLSTQTHKMAVNFVKIIIFFFFRGRTINTRAEESTNKGKTIE